MRLINDARRWRGSSRRSNHEPALADGHAASVGSDREVLSTSRHASPLPVALLRFISTGIFTLPHGQEIGSYRGIVCIQR